MTKDVNWTGAIASEQNSEDMEKNSVKSTKKKTSEVKEQNGNRKYN